MDSGHTHIVYGLMEIYSEWFEETSLIRREISMIDLEIEDNIENYESLHIDLMNIDKDYYKSIGLFLTENLVDYTPKKEVPITNSVDTTQT